MRSWKRNCGNVNCQEHQELSIAHLLSVATLECPHCSQEEELEAQEKWLAVAAVLEEIKALL